MTEIRTRVLDILDAAGIAYRLLPHAEAVFTIEARPPGNEASCGRKWSSRFCCATAQAATRWRA